MAYCRDFQEFVEESSFVLRKTELPGIICVSMARKKVNLNLTTLASSASFSIPSDVRIATLSCISVSSNLLHYSLCLPLPPSFDYTILHCVAIAAD